MIRIDAIWLASEPMDMRAGTETALAQVIAVFGAAKPHCAYLFANRRAMPMQQASEIAQLLPLQWVPA
ncbi:IS66 family insertion sequence element accessory protein TnpB [Pseudomonas sp. DE0157]|uniref:IS66 family insertion sequence element accessory protein TnpB n=1 Tax=Pseudomonas sp. DE0157 TaxID=2584952 RepID=UPI0011AAB1C0|nr:IS66 family insertion sequence element accessory protein TnpB [Pseudomonas sp. DE0157]